ncbi:hypothetical protein ACSBR1_012953 [Camellia fascicularis]
MIRLQIMNMRSDKRLLSSKWNKVLYARMDKVLEKALMDGRTREKNLNSFVEPFFHTDMYRQAYSFWIGLVPTVEKPVCSIDDAMILPPLSKRPTRRPKKNRIASTGESKRVMKCSRYGSIGRHNKTTCKEPLLNS